jgi:hypothetical protein
MFRKEEEEGGEKTKININLFISLYRRARRDRQRNLFDLIDICNHTAHDFSIIINTFVYLSVYFIPDQRKRENGIVIHHWDQAAF